MLVDLDRVMVRLAAIVVYLTETTGRFRAPDRPALQTALASLDAQLASRDWLCAAVPTAADIFCFGDAAFAELCAFDLARWPSLAARAARVRALPGFQAPLDPLPMQDVEIL